MADIENSRELLRACMPRASAEVIADYEDRLADPQYEAMRRTILAVPLAEYIGREMALSEADGTAYIAKQAIAQRALLPRTKQAVVAALQIGKSLNLITLTDTMYLNTQVMDKIANEIMAEMCTYHPLQEKALGYVSNLAQMGDIKFPPGISSLNTWQDFIAFSAHHAADQIPHKARDETSNKAELLKRVPSAFHMYFQVLGAVRLERAGLPFPAKP